MHLKQLEKKCKSCIKCPLSKTRNNVVFGKGNTNADILFIGEAPGKNEDIQGLPFVGAAGKQLDRLLNEINLNIDDVYIANILKCRPPNNRDPNNEEIKICTPHLIEQIKLIKPKVICTLGNYSTKFILAKCIPEEMKKIQGISKLHGKVRYITFDNTEFKVIPIFHPAATLYRPQLKETFTKDFKIIEKEIKPENMKKKQKSIFDY